MRKVIIWYDANPITLSNLKGMNFINNIPLSYRFIGRLFNYIVSVAKDIE